MLALAAVRLACIEQIREHADVRRRFAFVSAVLTVVIAYCFAAFLPARRAAAVDNLQ